VHISRNRRRLHFHSLDEFGFRPFSLSHGVYPAFDLSVSTLKSRPFVTLAGSDVYMYVGTGRHSLPLHKNKFNTLYGVFDKPVHVLYVHTGYWGDGGFVALIPYFSSCPFRQWYATLLLIFHRMWRWKKFENRSIFGKDMGENLRLAFLAHPSCVRPCAINYTDLVCIYRLCRVYISVQLKSLYFM